jgi:ribosomal protein S18 acetylase RimI-like enzyme
MCTRRDARLAPVFSRVSGSPYIRVLAVACYRGRVLRDRDARREDYAAFTAFWRELAIDQPPPSGDMWDAHLRPTTLFLEDEDRVLAAYACIFPQGPRGDVRQIVVAPAFRGRGVGRQLMAAVRRRLLAAGCRDWRLEVRADNAPAIALYRAMGMEVLRDIYSLRITLANAVAFARPGDVAEVAAVEEAALERSYDYGVGMLRRWRDLGRDTVIWRIGERALARMWSDFLPDGSLVIPFHATTREDTAALVAAMLARRQPAWFEIVTMDVAAREALLAAGAVVHDHQLEMGASLV